MSFSNRRQFLGASIAATVTPALLAQSSVTPTGQFKRRIFALGGGGLSLSDRDHLLLKYIISLTGKKNPQVCYLPTAAGDLPESIVTWYEVTRDLDCRPKHLRLINNATYLKELEKRMLSMDAFVVGGGNTLNMLAIWKAQGVDKILRKAWEQGIVLSGGSAGMICWFEKGVSDSRPGELTAVDGMGWLSGSVCPHYGHKNRAGKLDRKEAYSRLMLSGEIQDGTACDDDVGLLYEDTKLVRIVSDNPKAKAYRVRRAGDKVEEEALEVEYLKKDSN